MTQEAKSKSSWIAPTVLTTVVFVAAIFLWFAIQGMANREVIGSFVSGFASAIALIWLVAGYRLQAEELVSTRSELKGQKEQLMLLLREVDAADEILKQARALDRDSPDLDFLQASLHGLQAEFPLAREVHKRINRATPSKPQVLVQPIQVREQMRDYTAAVGYVRHALRIIRDAPELEAKRQRYQTLGTW